MDKIIFLDIDGVLNCQSSEIYMPGYYVGIDEDKLLRLKEIVNATGAQIVLSSSWKHYWRLEYKEFQNEFGNEIDNRLAPLGLLPIAKTEDPDRDGLRRGAGIIKWVLDHGVSDWVVLDDEIFPDFYDQSILPHLVKTTFYDDNGGLQPEHVKRAIEILNERKFNENFDKYGFFPLEHQGLEL